MRVRLNVARLREILAKSELSQNHWAIRLGVSRGHWSDLVNGNHPYPSPKTRQRMIEVLGVTTEDLFTIETGATTWHETDFRVALLDRYLIERELGQGAMGAVYVALDVARNRRVAVKVLAPEAVCGIGQDAFLREISTVSRLHHPNILPLLDSGVAAEHPFFVMPWARGGSLRDRLKRETRINLASVVALTRGIAAALTHTHGDFVLHCDVKPENVLLHDDHPWLTDFGISRVLHAEVSEWRTRKGIDVSAGTPAYVSPEQALGEELDGRTDTYSLGCVVYEMLTGRPPFEGTTTEAVVSKRFLSSAPPLRELSPDVPPAVAAAVARAMEIERDKRPATPSAFADELAAAARDAHSVRTRITLPLTRTVGAVRRRVARRRLSPRWEALWQDTRFAMRRLAREPAITAFMLCTLALGIGVNVTAFSVVDRVLLRGPQHVREPDRLVRIYSRADLPPMGLQTTPWLPHTAFTELRDGMQTIDAMGAYRVDETMVGSGVASEMRRVSRTSSEMFGLLGVRPLRGRFFGRDDDDASVAVIGERLWRTVFGSDASIVGKTIAVDDIAHTIIGVAPAGFTGPELGRVDVWTPIRTQARNSMNMQLVARLKQGARVDAAVEEVAQLRSRVEASLPSWARWLRGASYLAAPIRYDANAREPFEAVMARWLAAISAIILFISCANVANLLLARLARRRRELAVRVALGSGRARVVRLLALEGVLLAVGAAVVAFGVIVLVEPVVKNALFPGGAWALTLVDTRMLGAVVAFTLLTAAFVSVAPAIQAGRPAVADALRSTNRGGVPRSTLRSALTIVQATLSVVLLVGAGLFVRSLQRVNAVDLGLDPERVLAVNVRYPPTPRVAGESFDDRIARSGAIERARHRQLVDAVRRVPGVERAAVSVSVPFYGGVSVDLWVPGFDSIPRLPGGGPYVTAVGDDYFATMGTAIRQGRPFANSDREGSEPVAIVSEMMARVLWPGRAAIGECFHIHRREAPCARVVGIAADIHRSGLKEERSMQYYVPIGQESGFSGSWVLVRPRGAPSTSWPALRNALHSADPAIRSIDVRVLSQGIAGEVRPFRLGLVAFGLSAALALIVAALGLYSIMAHAVAWRRHEIGVRLALGARSQSIAALVMGQGTVLASIGIGAGLVVALAAQRWVEPLLFETSATDPVVLIGVVVVLEAVALLAGWIPARRAVRVSPADALRAE